MKRHGLLPGRFHRSFRTHVSDHAERRIVARRAELRADSHLPFMAADVLATGLPENRLRKLCKLHYAHHYWSPATIPGLVGERGHADGFIDPALAALTP